MKQGRLGQTGQSLVKALDHDIRAASEGRGRKLPGKSKMGAVGFIYNQRNAPGMGKLSDGLNIETTPS